MKTGDAATLIVAIIPTLGLVSTSLLLPVFDQIAQGDLTPVLLNAGIWGFLMAFAVSQAVVGALITPANARRILLFATAGVALLSAAYALAYPSERGVVAMRIALGLMAGPTVVAARFLLGRRKDPSDVARGFALSAAAFNILPPVALVVASAATAATGPRFPFVTVAVLATILCGALLFLAQSWPRDRRARRVPDWRQFPWPVAGLSALAYANVDGVQVLVASDPELPQIQRTGLLLVFSAGAVLGALMVGRMRSGFRSAFRLAMLAGFAGLAVSLPAQGPGYLLVAVAVCIVMPLSFTICLVETEQSNAAAISFLGALHLLGGALGAAMAGGVFPSQLPGQAWLLGLGAVATVLTLVMLTRTQDAR